MFCLIDGSWTEFARAALAEASLSDLAQPTNLVGAGLASVLGLKLPKGEGEADAPKRGRGAA